MCVKCTRHVWGVAMTYTEQKIQEATTLIVKLGQALPAGHDPGLSQAATQMTRDLGGLLSHPQMPAPEEEGEIPVPLWIRVWVVVATVVQWSVFVGLLIWVVAWLNLIGGLVLIALTHWRRKPKPVQFWLLLLLLVGAMIHYGSEHT